MATQELIWLFSEDTVVWKQNRDFSSETLNVEGEKNEIMTLVNNHDKLPSFINSSYTSEFGKELTLVDYNNVLSNYDISGDIAYTVNGNTININTNKVGKGTIYFNQKNFNTKETTVYVADRYNSQKIVVFGYPSLNSGNINISVDNAKIEFSKKDIHSNESVVELSSQTTIRKDRHYGQYQLYHRTQKRATSFKRRTIRHSSAFKRRMVDI